MIQWRFVTFSDLTTSELYDLLSLRQEVFILEQKCLYPDIDGLDKQAIHLIGRTAEKIVSYVRIFKSGILYPDAASFGRVAVAKSERGKGLAKEAINQTLQYLQHGPTIISAQLYLQKFYEDLKFKTTAAPHDEDGIPHVIMKYTK